MTARAPGKIRRPGDAFVEHRLIAAAPSRRSASARSSSGLFSSAERRSASSAACGNAASSAASCSAAARADPFGTTRFASPKSSASCALTARPVRIRSSARDNPIRRGRRIDAAVDQRNADAPAEHAQHRVFFDHPQVAHGGQFQPACHRIAGNRGDHRLAEAHPRGSHRAWAAAVGVQFVAAGVVGKRAQIRARAKRAARAEQHRRAPRGLRSRSGRTRRSTPAPADGPPHFAAPDAQGRSSPRRYPR